MIFHSSLKGKKFTVLFDPISFLANFFHFDENTLDAWKLEWCFTWQVKLKTEHRECKGRWDYSIVKLDQVKRYKRIVFITTFVNGYQLFRVGVEKKLNSSPSTFFGILRREKTFRALKQSRGKSLLFTVYVKVLWIIKHKSVIGFSVRLLKGLLLLEKFSALLK